MGCISSRKCVVGDTKTQTQINLERHYKDVAKVYEGAFFYESGVYQEWTLKLLQEHLQLGDSPSSLRLADVGGGTGNYTELLAVQLRDPVLCVDMSEQMLKVAAERKGVITKCQDAVTFALSSDVITYDRILLKEVIHHIPATEMAAMYAGLRKQLASGGRIVTITRPQEVDYPLFTAAREVWRKNQHSAKQIANAIGASGLDVKCMEAVYIATMPKQNWFDMVRSRFWSTFSAFSDKELEEGIAELAAKYADVDTVQFDDRLIILIGTKTS
jgi:2-polyprenyl-3-methyl-5-hydroxy-6-metoxy-1,4-benzoquinol methylase